MAKQVSKREHMGTLYFTIYGKDLTRIVRETWQSSLPKQAINILTKGLPGMSQKTAIKILIGETKLIGKNNKVYLRPDKSKHQQWSVKDLVAKLEKDLIDLEIGYNLTVVAPHYEDMVTGYRGRIMPSIYRSAKGYHKEILQTIEQILVLYPFVDKTANDIPLFDFTVSHRRDLEAHGIDPSHVYKSSEQRYREREERITWLLKESREEEKKNDEWEEQQQKGEKIFVAETMTSRIEDSMDLAKVMKEQGIPKGMIPSPPSLDKFIHDMTTFDMDAKPEPEEIITTEFNSGYIAPNGNFYGCPDLQHKDYGDVLREHNLFTSKTKDAQIALDELGWVKMSMGRFYFVGKKLKKKQLDTLFDYSRISDEDKLKFNDKMLTWDEIAKL